MDLLDRLDFDTCKDLDETPRSGQLPTHSIPSIIVDRNYEAQVIKHRRVALLKLIAETRPPKKSRRSLIPLFIAASALVLVLIGWLASRYADDAFPKIGDAPSIASQSNRDGIRD